MPVFNKKTDNLSYVDCFYTLISNNHFWKKAYYYIFILLFIFLSSPARASEDTSNPNAAIEQVNTAIQKKLDFYNRTFPRIQFVHLKNHQEWYKSLQALELLLGYQSTNLDFEHPVELREDLLFVTVEKIQMMLEKRITSSYLFKTGQIPAAKKNYVCMMTHDPETTTISNRVATAYFIDLPLGSLTDSRLLNKEKHLDFIIDHEAYHCLDTFFYGGIPMSKNEYSTQHKVYHRENEADMFALAMHFHRYKQRTDYARKIIWLRGMSLLNGEPQHYTTRAMNRIYHYNLQQFMDISTDDLLKLVKQLYRPEAPNYQQYLQYRSNTAAAVHKLGKQINEPDAPIIPDNLQPENDKVQDLIRETKHYYREFFGKPYSHSE